MGSKAPILEFVIEGINQVYAGGGVCDLFAGSCVLSGAIAHAVPVYSNDIQTYSKVLAGTYLTAWRDEASFETGDQIVERAASLVARQANRRMARSDLRVLGAAAKET